MAFGNPYGELYSEYLVIELVESVLVASNVSLSKLVDTYGGAPSRAHIHFAPEERKVKISAVLEAGCPPFMLAFSGIGGCPFIHSSVSATKHDLQKGERLAGLMPMEGLLDALSQYKAKPLDDQCYLYSDFTFEYEPQFLQHVKNVQTLNQSIVSKYSRDASVLFSTMIKFREYMKHVANINITSLNADKMSDLNSLLFIPSLRKAPPFQWRVLNCVGLAQASLDIGFVFTTKRFVIQSNSGGNLSSPINSYDAHQLKKQLRRNANGNYYRFQQKLWPSMESLERELTSLHYSSVERIPFGLLPQREAPEKVFILEGNGNLPFLDGSTSERGSLESSNSTQKKPVATLLADYEEAELPINDKIITEQDLEGSVLESARSRARNLIQDDLSSNALAMPGRSSLLKTRSSSDPGSEHWESLGLDPLVASAAQARFGDLPTRLQCRLIPSLIHEDHHDVLFNGVTGSGKTTALLLSILHAVRTESAGMNILITGSFISALQLHDTLRTLCNKNGTGGRMVDRPVDDFSWVYMGVDQDEYKNYYKHLKRSLRNPNGPIRLFITTAEVLCELLFEMKIEFKEFGYLRRVYVDDVSALLPMLPENAPVEDAKERLRNPLAIELLLGTLHQLPGPHIRSILQLGLVSADADTKLKNHLKSLCLKPEASTIVLAPIRLPPTIHCLFSYHLFTENIYTYTVNLIRKANDTIPGRAVIFIRAEDDMLTVRNKLRQSGMDAKMFSEIYSNGEFKDKWKFLLLKESEAFGVDLPLVSHVFITFAPRSWESFLHMCGRTGRLGNVGWVYTIFDKRDAKAVREVTSQLDVSFCDYVIDSNLNQIPPHAVESFTKDFELYGLDPQYAVKQHYEVQAENPEMAYRPREFFTHPANRQFQMEDYTPTSLQQRRFENARKLAQDVEKNPSIAFDLQNKGLLDQNFKPTEGLKQKLSSKPT